MLERQKRLNEVYEYLHNHFGVHTKGEFADIIKYARAYISSAMNGNERYLTDKLFTNICEAYTGTFNLDYLLTGNGQLLKNKESEPEIEEHSNHIDQSSLINALLAAKDQLIEELKEKYEKLEQEMEKIEREKDARISDLTKLAEERLHRIAELRRVIDAQDITTSNYPFPIGAADKKQHKNI